MVEAGGHELAAVGLRSDVRVRDERVHAGCIGPGGCPGFLSFACFRFGWTASYNKSGCGGQSWAKPYADRVPPGGVDGTSTGPLYASGAPESARQGEEGAVKPGCPGRRNRYPEGFTTDA